MHNPRIVVTLAVWFIVIHVGHMIVMGFNKNFKTYAARECPDDGAVRRRRVAAGLTAYAIALIAALAYFITRREKADRITYWAVGAIVFFGLAEAVYMAWPKLYRNDPTPADQQRQRRGARLSESVHVVALLSAIVAWVLTANMQPIAT